MKFLLISFIGSILIFISCKDYRKQNKDVIRIKKERIDKIDSNYTIEKTAYFEFDSVSTRKLESQQGFPNQITVSKFIGFKNDSIYLGIITSKNSKKIDSVYYLHTTNNRENQLPCFHGVSRFLYINNTTIYSFQVFDKIYSCCGGLGEQYVITDFWHKIDSNGLISLLDTNLNRPRYKLVGGGY